MRSVKLLLVVLSSISYTLFAAGSFAADVLLIPDSGADKIWAFDPQTGALISNNYIPADGRMTQPINAILSDQGTVLVSDETADSIFEYSLSGAYLRTVSGPANGLDALNGISLRGGTIYAAIPNGPLAGTIQAVDSVTGALTTFANSNILGARDLVFRSTDVIVTDSDDDNLEQLSLSGAYIATFHDSDGANGVDFPQQIQMESNGDLLVAGFTAPFGLYVYSSTGAQTRYYGGLITSPRGVYRLGNGNLLYAGGTRVQIVDAVTGIETQVVNQAGASFRYIELVPEPTFAAWIGLGCLTCLRKKLQYRR